MNLGDKPAPGMLWPKPPGSSSTVESFRDFFHTSLLLDNMPKSCFIGLATPLSRGKACIQARHLQHAMKPSVDNRRISGSAKKVPIPELGSMKNRHGLGVPLITFTADCDVLVHFGYRSELRLTCPLQRQLRLGLLVAVAVMLL